MLSELKIGKKQALTYAMDRDGHRKMAKNTFVLKWLI